MAGQFNLRRNWARSADLMSHVIIVLQRVSDASGRFK